jgi:anti-anti-sigma factor
MPEPADEFLKITSDDGVVTVGILAAKVEENASHAMLVKTQEAMDRAAGALRAVVLDFSDVEFINSAGLGACFELRNDAAGRGAEVILYRPTETVMQLFMMVNVESLFTIVHTAEELQRVLSPKGADA